jgi:hypothetical protein
MTVSTVAVQNDGSLVATLIIDAYLNAVCKVASMDPYSSTALNDSMNVEAVGERPWSGLNP